MLQQKEESQRYIDRGHVWLEVFDRPYKREPTSCSPCVISGNHGDSPELAVAEKKTPHLSSAEQTCFHIHPQDLVSFSLVVVLRQSRCALESFTYYMTQTITFNYNAVRNGQHTFKMAEMYRQYGTFIPLYHYPVSFPLQRLCRFHVSDPAFSISYIIVKMSRMSTHSRTMTLGPLCQLFVPMIITYTSIGVPL